MLARSSLDKEKLGYTGESSVQAAAAAFVDATPARKKNAMNVMLWISPAAMRLFPWTKNSIKNGKHVLVAYIGYDYLATAAHLAAESSPKTSRTFAPPMTSRSLSTPLSLHDPENEEITNCGSILFDRSVTNGRCTC
jgi:hypothetical protein